jgi:PIN domain nuclease of toxin-antitoxin system
MRLLLDTHSFLWFIRGAIPLSDTARNLIENTDNDIYLSSASLWEIAIKVSTGKLLLSQPYEVYIPLQVELNNFHILDISINHAARVATLPFHHRDPFDRLLIAQSFVEQMPLISNETLFDAYNITRLW